MTFRGSPLCPSDISPASGGNPASQPLLWVPACAGMTYRGAGLSALRRASPCPLLKEGVVVRLIY